MNFKMYISNKTYFFLEIKSLGLLVKEYVYHSKQILHRYGLLGPRICTVLTCKLGSSLDDLQMEYGPNVVCSSRRQAHTASCRKKEKEWRVKTVCLDKME